MSRLRTMCALLSCTMVFVMFSLTLHVIPAAPAPVSALQIALTEAVNNNDIGEAQNVLDTMEHEHSSPNFTTHFVINNMFYSPLKLAARKYNIHMMNLLLDNGADPNYRVRDVPLVWDLLNYFVFNKWNPMVDVGEFEVRILLEKGADANGVPFLGVNGNGRRYETPLKMAIELGLINLVDSLINHGAQVNPEGEDLDVALIAVRNDNPEMVDLLIRHGAKFQSFYHEIMEDPKVSEAVKKILFKWYQSIFLD